MKEFFGSKKGKIFTFSALGVVVVAIIAAVIIVPKFFGGGYRTIAVEEIVGTVTVKNETDGLHNAYEGMHLVSGDEVTVGEDSSLTLKLDGDKYVIADAGTHFWVEASGDNKKKSDMRTFIYMDSGSILNKLNEKLGLGEVYEVQTPNSIAAVRGTTFRVTVYAESVSEEGVPTVVENYTQIEVEAGVVKVELKKEDGEKIGESKNFEAGENALIYSNPEISEFVGETGKPAQPQQPVENLIEEHKEHTAGEWFVTKVATCQEEGKKSLLCSVCNEVMEEEVTAIATHNYEEVSIQVTKGCSITTTVKNVCCVCEVEEMVSEEVIESHSFGAWTTTKAATCTATGLAVRNCSVCGKQETQSIAKVAHVFDDSALWQVIITPTCTENGVRQRQCINCMEGIDEVIPAIGHNYTYTSDNHNVSELNHDSSLIGMTHNCTAVGTCSNCSQSITETHSVHIHCVMDSNNTIVGYTYTCEPCGLEW